MRGYRLALSAEWYRLVRLRSLWLSLLLLSSIAAGYVCFGRLSEKLGMRASAPEGLEQGGDGWVHWVDAWRFTLSATCLLLLIQAARSISADRASGVLRLGLLRASSRSALVLARASMALPMVLLAFLCSGLSAWAASTLFYDFGPLIEDGYELMSAQELRVEASAASLATLLPLLAMHAYGVLLSALNARPVRALSLALLSLLCYDLFKDFLGRPIPWFFATYAPTFSDTSALSEMSGVASGFSDMGYSTEALLASTLVPLPYIAICLALACLATARRPA